jgi:hypothetical protein
MKKLVLTFALSVLSAAAASAQGVYIEQRGGMAGGFEGGWDGDRGRHRGWDAVAGIGTKSELLFVAATASRQ